jgi:vacuolar-type H+-ATPase subunit H
MVMPTTNALEAIRKIESQAEEIVGDASKKAESIKKKAVDEGEKTKKQLIDDANKKISDYRKRKEKETEKESNDIMVKGKQEANELKSRTASRITDAVDVVVKIAVGE